MTQKNDHSAAIRAIRRANLANRRLQNATRPDESHNASRRLAMVARDYDCMLRNGPAMAFGFDS